MDQWLVKSERNSQLSGLNTASSLNNLRVSCNDDSILIDEDFSSSQLAAIDKIEQQFGTQSADIKTEEKFFEDHEFISAEEFDQLDRMLAKR
jgi:hypothetical protein